MVTQLPNSLNNRLKRVPLIWGTLTVFSMLLPLMTLLTPPATNSSERSSVLLPVFLGMGVMMMATSLFVRFVILSENKLKQFALTKLKGLAKEEALERLFKHWMVLNIIAWALNDSVANLGAVAAQISGSATIGTGFTAVALVLNLFMYPKFHKAAKYAAL